LAEIEEIIKMLRLSLYNRDVFCGAQAIRWEMEDLRRWGRCFIVDI
jgi:hypothetical protein